jgi:hypothetical protein
MLDLSYMIWDMTDNKDYTRRNRFTGESVEFYKFLKKAFLYLD